MMRTLSNLTKYAIGVVYFGPTQKRFFWWIGVAVIVFSGAILNNAFIKGNPSFLFWAAGAFLFFGSYLMIKFK